MRSHGPALIEVTGVLAPFAGRFRAGLTDQGFAPWAVAGDHLAGRDSNTYRPGVADRSGRHHPTQRAEGNSLPSSTSGSVALVPDKIEAGLVGEAVDQSVDELDRDGASCGRFGVAGADRCCQISCSPTSSSRRTSPAHVLREEQLDPPDHEIASALP
jgi:hypothetical protein